MSEGTNNQWFASEGIDPSLVTEKVKSFTNEDGTMNTNELLKSYNSAQSMIGASVRIPTDTSTDEERAEFFAKLGRPESPDKYNFQIPEGISVEGATKENFAAFQKLCFENGLSNKQYAAVMGGWADIVKELNEKGETVRREIFENSKKVLSAPSEWGDQYQTKYDATMGLIDKLKIRPHLEAAGVLNMPEVLKAFNSIVDEGKETGLRGGGGSGGSSAERIAELKSSPAYLNSSHPDHSKTIGELNRLLDAR